MRKIFPTYEDLESKIKELEINNWEVKYLEEKYQSIFDDAPLGIFRCTPEGEFLEVNDAFASILGYVGIDDFFRQNMSDLHLIFANKEEKDHLLGNVYLSKQAVKSEVSFVGSQGRQVIIGLCLKVIRNKDGRPVYLEGTVEDISERKRTEESLLYERNQLRTLIDSLPDFIYVKDLTLNYVLCNKAYARFLGLPSQRAISGQSDNSFFPENIVRLIENDERAVLQSGRSLSREDTTYDILSQGRELVTYTTRVPIHDKSGQVAGLIGIIRDVSGLQKAHNLQQAILNNIPFHAWLKDAHGKYISINEPFSVFLRKSPAEVIGKSDSELLPAEKADLYQYYEKEVVASGKRIVFEDRDQGKKSWYETQITPIFNLRKEIIGISGISRDITDQKNYEDKIKASEERFRALLHNSSDAITILNRDGIIKFESALTSGISEFSIEELIGRNLFDFVHHEDKDSVAELLLRVRSMPDKVFKMEYRSLHKHRKWVYVESIFVNKLHNPYINGIVVNSRDISERKMAELKEKAYHENLLFLSNSALELMDLNHTGDIYRYISDKLYNYLDQAVVLVSSYEGTGKQFVARSHRGAEHFQVEIERFLGQPIAKLNYPLIDPIREQMHTGNLLTLYPDRSDFEFPCISKEKIEKLVRLLSVNKVYSICLSHENRILGNVIIITRNKQIINFKSIIETFFYQVSVALHRSILEQELMDAKVKAEESDKLKSAFLANMSHEIRTPMNGIIGFSELIDDENISEGNRKKYIEIIRNNGKMLVNLINDIIDFSKIEAGQVHIISKVFSLNQLLANVHASFLTENLKQNKPLVKLRVRRALDNDKCFISSDPVRLQQILNNLVGNALKFTDEGFVEFGYTLEAETGMLQFYVTDSGIGIPEDKLQTIFDRFVQADNSSTRKYGGSGLGLPISRGFVELLGGRMWVKSKLGEGSTFFFTLPYHPSEHQNVIPVNKSVEKKMFNWEGKTFLVAEDDKFSYKFLETLLRQQSAHVIHADNGRKAVDICKLHGKIDLVLMDIQMPEMNGYEATELIRKAYPHLPVIAQTANALSEERDKCFAAGCTDFVTKPVNSKELYFKIDKYLRQNEK